MVGLRPRADNVLEIAPLIPKGQWAWFCLDNVAYHGHILTILWDEKGSKYHHGAGFFVYADGKVIYHGTELKKVTIKLNS